MPAERYYLDDPLSNSSCQLQDAEFHHLAHVMRTRKGDSVELVNGKGALAHATVEYLGKERATLTIQSLKQVEEPACRIMLAQAIPKPNRLDFILEKGTELGVDSFWLFQGNLSAKKEFFPHQLERARLLTIAAMKQCGRLFLPSIELKPPLAHWSSLTDVNAFFGDVKPTAPLFDDYLKTISASDRPVLFFTGPESGFNLQEVEVLTTLGARGVKLHANTLRTDTASLVALSLISHRLLSKTPV
jgi:16S rRNA (uracil1498-N3)-methyltransferase